MVAIWVDSAVSALVYLLRFGFCILGWFTNFEFVWLIVFGLVLSCCGCDLVVWLIVLILGICCICGFGVWVCGFDILCDW